jgi:uncharacterized protein (DUF927 family)
LAALHNDGLLILDEYSQIAPSQAGEAAYMLSNGQGKTRANRIGAARAAATWRLLFLSSSEESLSAMMAKSSQKAQAGQEVRMADIDADAGAGLGLFENIHESPSPSAFALALRDAAAAQHGVVGMAWLRAVVENRAGLSEVLPACLSKFAEAVAPADSGGQVVRVARRFALCSVAGELATQEGLTGWQTGEADRAAQTCFAAWLSGFGGAGNLEERAMLSQVRAFFELHGASRFEDMNPVNPDKAERIINRAGFFRMVTDGRREYLVLPEAFRNEVCRGLDAKAVKVALINSGMLIPAKNGQPSQNVWVPGFGSTKVYLVQYKGGDE